MSSHREAPQISKDPTADSTDVYAFRSPDEPSTVTLICNYVPLQLPDGGPNFYEFADDVTYDINIDNTGTGTPNITYRFNFTTTVVDPNVFLYNTGAITSLTGTGAATWNRPQTYSLTRIDYDKTAGTSTSTVLGSKFLVPPCNIGTLSTPDYQKLGAEACQYFTATTSGKTGRVFAGQRAEGFYVDLGAIFDLGTLRPIQQLHEGAKGTAIDKMAKAVNSTNGLNVHSLMVQVPITDLTAGGTLPVNQYSTNAVIGVWTAASRSASSVLSAPAFTSGTTDGSATPADAADPAMSGDLVQVSRLGNPLVNEALIGMGYKDTWNKSTPADDKYFLSYFSNPLLATLLPDLYPGAFPNLAAYNAVTTNTRPDIEAILLTGIPRGIIAKFNNALAQTGVYADMLRLNVFYPPAKTPNAFGLLGGDVAGFPNGRRVWDDVTSIELKALAGATLPLVDSKFKADAAVGDVNQGFVPASGSDVAIAAAERYEASFPYLGRPYSGESVGEIPMVEA